MWRDTLPSSNKFKESLLTSRVLTAQLKHRYLCLQSPPCSSNTQNTQGGTCALQPPGNKNKLDNLPFSQKKKKVSRDQEAVFVLSCVMDRSAVCFPVLSCALSSDTVATPASLSVCLESAMMSAPAGLSLTAVLAFRLFSSTLPTHD